MKSFFTALLTLSFFVSASSHARPLKLLVLDSENDATLLQFRDVSELERQQISHLSSDQRRLLVFFALAFVPRNAAGSSPIVADVSPANAPLLLHAVARFPTSIRYWITRDVAYIFRVGLAVHGDTEQALRTVYAIRHQLETFSRLDATPLLLKIGLTRVFLESFLGFSQRINDILTHRITPAIITVAGLSPQLTTLMDSVSTYVAFAVSMRNHFQERLEDNNHLNSQLLRPETLLTLCRTSQQLTPHVRTRIQIVLQQVGYEESATEAPRLHLDSSSAQARQDDDSRANTQPDVDAIWRIKTDVLNHEANRRNQHVGSLSLDASAPVR